MSVVKKLYIQTQALETLLDEPFPSQLEARDEYIQSITDHLTEREKLILQLDRHSFSETEKKLSDELYRLNEKVTKKIVARKDDIQTHIAQLRTKKKTGLKYENPYGERTIDGVFFDQRVL